MPLKLNFNESSNFVKYVKLWPNVNCLLKISILFNVILKVEICLKEIIQMPIKNEISVNIITVELALCDHFGSDINRKH
jgi:hypothetical protein